MSPSIAQLLTVLPPADASTPRPRPRERQHGAQFLRSFPGTHNFAAAAILDLVRAAQIDLVAQPVAVSTSVFEDVLTRSGRQILSITSPSMESLGQWSLQDALEVAIPLSRDIRIVRDPSTSEDERLMALERIAEDVPWPPSKHAARGGTGKIRAAFTAYVAALSTIGIEESL